MAPPTGAEMRREAYLRLLDAIIGDQNGVHLADLYATLRCYDHWARWTDAELRALLDDVGVPVRRTLRVGTVVGRSGVHIDDVLDRMTGVPVPSPPPTPTPAPQCEEAGQSYVERPVERPVERGVEQGPEVAQAPPKPVSITTTRPCDEPAWTTQRTEMPEPESTVDYRCNMTAIWANDGIECSATLTRVIAMPPRTPEHRAYMTARRLTAAELGIPEARITTFWFNFEAVQPGR
jgi:hypothetical protein